MSSLNVNALAANTAYANVRRQDNNNTSVHSNSGLTVGNAGNTNGVEIKNPLNIPDAVANEPSETPVGVSNTVEAEPVETEPGNVIECDLPSDPEAVEAEPVDAEVVPPDLGDDMVYESERFYEVLREADTEDIDGRDLKDGFVTEKELDSYIEKQRAQLQAWEDQDVEVDPAERARVEFNMYIAEKMKRDFAGFSSEQSDETLHSHGVVGINVDGVWGVAAQDGDDTTITDGEGSRPPTEVEQMNTMFAAYHGRAGSPEEIEAELQKLRDGMTFEELANEWYTERKEVRENCDSWTRVDNSVRDLYNEESNLDRRMTFDELRNWIGFVYNKEAELMEQGHSREEAQRLANDSLREEMRRYFGNEGEPHILPIDETDKTADAEVIEA